MKVLLVEDNPDIQRMLARTLKRSYECDIWVADHGALAIAYLGDALLDKPFDLIISDWNLSGSLTGGDVLSWVQEHASQLVRRFMFFSGNDAIKKYVGQAAVLEKPSTPDLIRRAIEHVVTRANA